MTPQEHPTWDIFDSSKVQQYITCPRSYFYRYVLGWETEGENIHLVFGDAWHKAIEVIYMSGGVKHDVDLISAAYDRFLEVFTSKFPTYDEGHKAKSADNALLALDEWCRLYSGADEEVLCTETAGKVPIDDNYSLTFRVDTLLHDRRGLVNRDAKTGSALTAVWEAQWNLKTQIGTYTHALYALAPALGVDRKDVFGIEIDGAIFRMIKKDGKPNNAFIRVDMRKTLESLNMWLHNVRHYIYNIVNDTDKMMREGDSPEVMESFPLNTEACCMYHRVCKYHDFCIAWSNPMRRCAEVPMDFKQEWWDPTKYERESPNVLVDGKIERRKDEEDTNNFQA